MHLGSRIVLSFGCLLLAVTFFSLLFNLLFSGISSSWAESFLFTFRFTMIFALPVWCLYLPFVIALKDAEERRGGTILGSGTLIGPVSLALWGLLLQGRGGNPHQIWYGGPIISLGGIAAMIFAFLVGFFTSSLYVIALHALHSRLRSVNNQWA